MTKSLNMLLRVAYERAFATVRELAPEKATILRQAALQLIAFEMLTVFHRAPHVWAISVKVDYSPENEVDRYEVSARNGFFALHGDTTASPGSYGLVDSHMPLELMSSGEFTLRRDDVLVHLSLTDASGADRLLHHRVVQQLATELDIHFPFP